jgi:amidase
MARNVPDLALMLDAMAVLTQHDPLSRPVPEDGFQAALQRARPPRRIGFSPNFGLRSIDREVGRICRAGAQRFTEMGCVMDEEVPDFSGRDRLFSSSARPSFR